MRGGFQIVTPDGEIVRSSGAISGGSAQQRQHGLLSREREWRDLPAEIKRATDQLKALDKQERMLAVRLPRHSSRYARPSKTAGVTGAALGLASRHDKTSRTWPR